MASKYLNIYYSILVFLPPKLVKKTESLANVSVISRLHVMTNFKEFCRWNHCLKLLGLSNLKKVSLVGLIKLSESVLGSQGCSPTGLVKGTTMSYLARKILNFYMIPWTILVDILTLAYKTQKSKWGSYIPKFDPWKLPSKICLSINMINLE